MPRKKAKHLSVAKTPVQTRFDEDTVGRLDAATLALGGTRSDTIRHAVEQYLEARKCRRCHGTGREE